MYSWGSLQEMQPVQCVSGILLIIVDMVKAHALFVRYKNMAGGHVFSNLYLLLFGLVSIEPQVIVDALCFFLEVISFNKYT